MSNYQYMQEKVLIKSMVVNVIIDLFIGKKTAILLNTSVKLGGNMKYVTAVISIFSLFACSSSDEDKLGSVNSCIGAAVMVPGAFSLCIPPRKVSRNLISEALVSVLTQMGMTEIPKP